MNIAADTWQYNSLLASALKIIEQENELTFFFQKKVVRDSRLIASENSFPGKLFADNYQKNSLSPSVNTEIQCPGERGCRQLAG